MPDSQIPFVRRCLNSGGNFADFQVFWDWFKRHCDTTRNYTPEEAAEAYDFWKHSA